jgi:hypothetical protein
MQKDFMGMAQGQVAPQEGAGEPRENIIENLTLLVEQAGMSQDMDPAELQKDIEELADLIIAEDLEGMEKNKLYKIITIMFEETEKMQQQGQPTGGPVPQQGEAPKDFASMMPPTPGGGMSGR